MTFADRLKELRKERNITQVQLAQALEVSKGTVAMWETGKREPGFETLCTLSEFFDRRIDYILGRTEDTSAVNATEEDYEELGRIEVAESFYETVMAYFALDAYGKDAVESLIKAEKLRCHEQQSLMRTDNIELRIKLKPEA